MVLTTPNLGTPSAAFLTNATLLPLGTGLAQPFPPPVESVSEHAIVPNVCDLGECSD